MLLGVGVALAVVVALTDVGLVVADAGRELLKAKVELLELDVIVLVLVELELSGVISSSLLKQVRAPWT